MDIALFNLEAFKADPALFITAWIMMITLLASPFIVFKVMRRSDESDDDSTPEPAAPKQVDEVLLIDVERRGNRQFDRINNRYLPNGELVDEDEKFEVKRPDRKQLPKGKR